MKFKIKMKLCFLYIFFSRKLNDRNYEISLSPFFSKMISEGLDLCLQRFLIKEVPNKLEYSCAIIKF